MHDIHIQLTEQLYIQAKRRAEAAGFSNLDEYIVDVVSEDVAQETENLDHRFTPKVMAQLNQIQDEIKAGAKTYTEAELDEYLQERTRAWRDVHVD